MKKKISWILSFLFVFILAFSNIVSTNTVKALTNYDDVVIGTKNLNNTLNNSAKWGDKLVEPEKGWKRYDDANSKIKYIGSDWDHWVESPYSYGDYKNTYSTNRIAVVGDKIVFGIKSQKLRIIQAIGLATNPDDEQYLVQEVFADGVSIGQIKNVAISGQGGYQMLVFEYNFNTSGYHNIEIRQIKNHYTLSLDAIDIDETGELLDSSAMPVPLYRYYNQTRKDHFYTANYSEAGAGDPNDYMYEGIVGCIYKSQVPGTVPLYRYYNAINKDHFYTTNYSEAGAGDPNGFMYEGITGYVYNSQMQGTIPVYRYYNATNKDHFYTSVYSEAGAGDPNGYVYEGIACYVIPYVK